MHTCFLTCVSGSSAHTCICGHVRACVFVSAQPTQQPRITALGKHFSLNIFSLCLQQLSHGSADILEWAAVQTSGHGGSLLSKRQSHIYCAVTVTHLTQSEIYTDANTHTHTNTSNTLRYPPGPDMFTQSRRHSSWAFIGDFTQFTFLAQVHLVFNPWFTLRPRLHTLYLPKTNEFT